MAVASCLREFLGLHQGCGSSVCHFSLLVIICFFSQCFIKILHGIVIVTFLIVHVCYTYSCIGSRVNLIHVLRCLEVNFAFVALHQFQDVQCLLQESGVSLACFHLRTIDILQRFTISYTTLNEHGHEVILDSLHQYNPGKTGRYDYHQPLPSAWKYPGNSATPHLWNHPFQHEQILSANYKPY